MIIERESHGETVLAVDTEEEFWEALNSGHPVEVTRELGDRLGIVEGDGGHTPKEVWEAQEIEADAYGVEDTDA